MGTGKITVLTGDGLEMDISLNLQPPAPLPVTLILALPRPNILKRTLQSVSAMGVKKYSSFIPVRWKKFLVKPGPAAGEDPRAIDPGLEQGKDTILPDVQLRKNFKPFVEDELPDLIQGTRALVAHPRASEECPRDVRGTCGPDDRPGGRIYSLTRSKS